MRRRSYQELPRFREECKMARPNRPSPTLIFSFRPRARTHYSQLQIGILHVYKNDDNHQPCARAILPTPRKDYCQLSNYDFCSPHHQLPQNIAMNTRLTHRLRTARIRPCTASRHCLGSSTSRYRSLTAIEISLSSSLYLISNPARPCKCTRSSQSPLKCKEKPPPSGTVASRRHLLPRVNLNISYMSLR